MESEIIICPQCGVNLPEGRESCYNCGYSFVPEKDENIEQKSKKKTVIIISVIIILIFIAMAVSVALIQFNILDIGMKPSLSIVNLEGENRLRISGVTNTKITVEIMNSGYVDAKSDEITIVIKTNVEEKQYNWTGWDIDSDTTLSGSFKIKINQDTDDIKVTLLYKGEKMDEARLLITILPLYHTGF